MNDRMEEAQENQQDGIWIGIDLGTSNSTCSVWDSSRGGAKWVRLPTITESDGHKSGRIMPSVVRFRDNKNSDNETENNPLVGFPALMPSSSSEEQHRSSLFRSVKRLLGKQYEDLDSSWIEGLDFDVRKTEKGMQLIGKTESSSSKEAVVTTPEEILALELKAMRIACQAYLTRNRRSKNLRVPGADDDDDKNKDSNNNNDKSILPLVNNVVLGVPANFSHRQIDLVKEACRQAGFHGYVGTCLESTAAAIAYGLTLQERSKKVPTNDPAEGGPTIMVVDMGGGTTDITIATSRKNLPVSFDKNGLPDETADLSSSYQVLVTEGDGRLGGDDIDESIMEYCMAQSSNNGTSNERDGAWKKNDSLKLACRKAKEALCRMSDPSPSESIFIDPSGNPSSVKEKNRAVEITQEIFERIIMEPWLRRARDLILQARDDLDEAIKTAEISIDEVVLVGGTTRIPVIRRMIQDVFPDIEVSSSLNPMSSVSQGLAIQAAIVSKKVPLHELKSAMMLDCVPHAIGVQLCSTDGSEQGFVNIIPRNALLPAAGSATFALANKYQAGVTVRAVEEVCPGVYEPMRNEDFSFILRKLTAEQFESISHRTIQVGMKLDVDGRFIVSIFDENDPEQVLKKDRFERTKKLAGDLEYIIDMIKVEHEHDSITSEQITLMVALISLFVLYIAVKMTFTDPLEGGNYILR